jgi:hypothetical protein
MIPSSTHQYATTIKAQHDASLARRQKSCSHIPSQSRHDTKSHSSDLTTLKVIHHIILVVGALPIPM